MKKLYVINAKGEKEFFSLLKIENSAKQVGASDRLARRIAKKIRKESYPDIKTSVIAKKVKNLLASEVPKFALKFHLKKGMRKLGPTGFLFEKYIGEIFSQQGFNVKLNQEIKGACCSYEVDFLAAKKKLIYIGECKYRNLAGEKIDSNVALENYARFLDIKKRFYTRQKKNKTFQIKSIIVTNTKFTSRTIQYSKCVGIDLLGWKYPKKRGLEILIDRRQLYPITMLPSLKGYLVDLFTSKGIMLVKDILRIDLIEFTKTSKIPFKHIEPLIKEAKILLE